jgi:exopolysaccharide/PEP-CTERM locus tyrosine autokinase
MDVIDKSGGGSNTTRPRKSLVEKAADRMGTNAWKDPVKTPERPGTAAAPAISPTQGGGAGTGSVAAHAPTVERAPTNIPVVPPAAREGLAPDKRQTKRVVHLNPDGLRAAGLVVPGEQSSVAEEIRLIKRPLLLSAFSGRASGERRSHLIMVTSALPREGKTFTAANLALSMASEPDITVLLIDADMAQPRIPQLLGFEAEKGLADILRNDKIDLADVMVRTNYDNLSIIPAGAQIPDANELFASSRMAKFIGDIARRYSDRVIILDSPPVLARSEPSVLAMHVGQIAFVVQAERTSEAALREGLAMVNGCKHVSLILNKVGSLYAGDRFGKVGAGYGY